jgi:uncharacterized small protein (DUF1192 family)
MSGNRNVESSPMQTKKYQPICLICHLETCDVAGCDKRTKFLAEEVVRLRAELEGFTKVKA